VVVIAFYKAQLLPL